MSTLAVQAVYKNDDLSGTAIGSLAVTGVVCNSNDSIIVKTKIEGGAATTITVTDGGDTFTNETQSNHGLGEPHLATSYSLNIASGGTKTVTVTFGANRSHVRVFVYVCRPGSGETVARIAFIGATGTNTAPNSGNVSPSAGANIAIAGMAEYAASTPSAWTINGVAGTVEAGSDNNAWAWYISDTAGWTNGAAAITGYANNRWCCDLIVLQSTGGGGNVTTRQLTDNISVVDSEDEFRARIKQLTDSLSVSDGDAFYRSLNLQVTDLLDVIDSIDPRRLLTRQLIDVMVVVDSMSNGIGQIIARTLTDTLDLGDSIARILTRAREDYTDVNDSAGTIRERIRGLSDSILLIDSIMDSHAVRNRISESGITVTDAIIRLVLLTRAMSDTITLSDSKTAAYYAASSVAIEYILRGFEPRSEIFGFEG